MSATARTAAALGGLGALGLLGLATAPAVSAGSAVGLSADGVHWSSAMDTPLFDPAIRWVPGDVRVARFWVRNQGASGADLTVRVRAAGQDRLVGAGDVGFEARAGNGRWQPSPRVDGAHRLNAAALGVGGRTQVEVRAAFDPAATNQSQQEHSRLRFLVTLADAGVGSGLLPGTGAPDVRLPLFAAAALIGSGWALTRRRDREVVR